MPKPIASRASITACGAVDPAERPGLTSPKVPRAAQHFARALTAAAVAARDGAAQIGSARTAVIDMVADVRADGYTVADDGTVSPPSIRYAGDGGARPAS